jgi:hypothetical protein
MLALTLVTIMLVQAPQEPQAVKAWVDQAGDPSRPDSYVVSGLPELTRQAAWQSARVRAAEGRQERLAAAGQRYLQQHVPVWLPAFVGDRVLREWRIEEGRREPVAELDREMIVRDHAFAKSYQGFLLLEEPDVTDAVARSLGPRLSNAARGFLRRCGAVGVLWALLALGAFWLDRLTRGYMTARLGVLAVVAGVAGPVLIMLL